MAHVVGYLELPHRLLFRLLIIVHKFPTTAMQNDALFYQQRLAKQLISIFTYFSCFTEHSIRIYGYSQQLTLDAGKLHVTFGEILLF